MRRCGRCVVAMLPMMRFRTRLRPQLARSCFLDTVAACTCAKAAAWLRSRRPRYVDQHLKLTRQADKRDRKRKRRRASSVASGSKAALQSMTDAHILAGLGYDVATHAAESTDWLNVIVAQVIAAYRASVHANGSVAGLGAKGIVEEALNSAKPDDDVPGIVSIDRIVVTEVDLGEDYPIVTNARVRPSDEGGRVVRQPP